MAADPFEDPFEDFPEDNAEGVSTAPEEEPEPAPKKTTRKAPAKKATTKKETAVAEAATQETNDITLTFKGHGGYDAPWVVIRTKTLAEADETLSEDNRDLLKAVLEKTQQAASYFISKAPESKQSKGGGGSNAGSKSAPQGAQEAPNGETRVCEHGEKMKYRSGISQKTGNPYKMFVCDAGVPREQECKPQFLR